MAKKFKLKTKKRERIRLRKPKLMIVDGHSQLYRAFHTPAPDMQMHGVNTKVIFMFLRMVLATYKALQPTHLAICFDGPAKHLWRTAAYPEYKANRDHSGDAMEDFFRQVEVVKEIVAKMDIQQVTGKSQEADDLIAAIAFQAREEGDMPVVIVTRDKDIEQIVSTQVTIFDPQTETLRTPGTVLETRGFGPGNVVEYLAMAGDASDNIPGIKGIGEIGAAKLLANYGSISGIYDNLESIPAGQRKKLQEGRAQVPLWVKLVTLDETAVLPFTIDELKLSRPNYEAAKPLFKKYGFRAIT